MYILHIYVYVYVQTYTYLYIYTGPLSPGRGACLKHREPGALF